MTKKEVPDPINPWKGLKPGLAAQPFIELYRCQTPLIPGRD